MQSQAERLVAEVGEQDVSCRAGVVESYHGALRLHGHPGGITWAKPAALLAITTAFLDTQTVPFALAALVALVPYNNRFLSLSRRHRRP